MIWENFKMALASLRAAKLRSFLTMLGVIIGVAAVTSVVSIGQGVKTSVTKEVSAYGTNVLQVNPGQSIGEEGEEGSGGFNPASAFGTSTLTEKDLASVQKIEGVEAAAPAMLISGVLSSGDKKANGYISGTTPDMGRTITLKYEHGGFLTSNTEKQIVIGPNVAKDLFDSYDVVGKQVTLRNTNFKIVGVMQKPDDDSLLSAQTGAMVFIPYEVAKDFNQGVGSINEIDIKAASADQVTPVKERVTEAIKANHGGEKDFTVMTAEEQLKAFDNILAILTSFISAIAGISLLVGGIGIMNIMLVSVTERTREIGIRKAIGATRSMILTQFLIEALTLTILGGLLGLGLAYLQGLAVHRLAKITPVFSLSVFATALGISVIIGVIFGLAPAIKAARKRPIQALRYE